MRIDNAGDAIQRALNKNDAAGGTLKLRPGSVFQGRIDSNEKTRGTCLGWGGKRYVASMKKIPRPDVFKNESKESAGDIGVGPGTIWAGRRARSRPVVRVARVSPHTVHLTDLAARVMLFTPTRTLCHQALATWNYGDITVPFTIYAIVVKWLDFYHDPRTP